MLGTRTVGARVLRGILSLGVGLSFCGTIQNTPPRTAHAQRAGDAVEGVWTAGQAPEAGWTVGDIMPLRLLVTSPVGAHVTLPALPGRWGPFEVQDQKLVEPVAQDDGTLLSVREALVTVWAPGEHATPEYTISYEDAAGILHDLPVQPVQIRIVSVLPEQEEGDSTSAEKYDLKPQAALPRPPVWPWLLVGAAAAALLFLLIRWVLERRRGVDEASLPVPVDSRFPEEIAYGELDRIESLDLPSSGRWKEHYTLVTDCVRGYVEGIFHIQAMERSTEELLVTLRRERANGAALPDLSHLLEEADLVKFAKVRPSVERARASVGQARGFVDVTKPARFALEEQGVQARPSGQV